MTVVEGKEIVSGGRNKYFTTSFVDSLLYVLLSWNLYFTIVKLMFHYREMIYENMLLSLRSSFLFPLFLMKCPNAVESVRHRAIGIIKNPSL